MAQAPPVWAPWQQQLLDALDNTENLPNQGPRVYLNGPSGPGNPPLKLKLTVPEYKAVYSCPKSRDQKTLEANKSNKTRWEATHTLGY